MSAWSFNSNGSIKTLKNEADRSRAKEIYQRAKEVLRYTRSVIGDSNFKRTSCTSFPYIVINGKEEWTITITSDNEIIVMHKD